MTATGTARDRAVGALLGLAVGDALGMPTQSMSRSEIARTYGTIDTLVAAAENQPIAPLMKRGSITDDTEQALLLAKLLVDGEGRVDPLKFADALAHWERAMEAKGSRDLLGPSTKAAITAIQAGARPSEDPGRFGTTNGAAMRIAPVGIAFDCDTTAFAKVVVECSALTHNTGLGLSAAGAVATAVSYAISHPDAATATIIDASATAAERLGNDGNWVAGGAVGPRIRWACTTVATLSATESLNFIADIVGTSVASQESIPATFALIARFGDDPFKTLCHAASIGGDTDTIAAMAGAVLGARYGADAWPAEISDTVLEVNGLDLATLSDQLLALRTL